MSSRIVCDCGCGELVTGSDAALTPIFLRHAATRARFQVTLTDSLETVNFRPECMAKILGASTLIHEGKSPGVIRSIGGGVG